MTPHARNSWFFRSRCESRTTRLAQHDITRATIARAATFAAVFVAFGASVHAQPRLLDAELTLAQTGAGESVWETPLDEATLQALDNERPPRPLRPPIRTSAGYRSGRWPLMIGLSLLSTGTALAATFASTICYDPRERYTGADLPALISVGLGVSLTLAGAIRLARLPGPRRRPRLAGAIVGTVLMSALTFGALALTQANWIGCISS
ncbi:MAG: hypothetical protein ACI9KE_002234 [Polyangiales bacterium]|jgi:hypothetical protein